MSDSTPVILPLHATFVHDKRIYNAVGRMEIVQNRRCAHAPTRIITVDHIVTSKGLVLHPIERSGIHAATMRALESAAEKMRESAGDS